MAGEVSPPGERQAGEDQPAGKRRDRLGQREAIGGVLDGGIEELVLLADIAERPDRRQDRRVAAEALDQFLAEGADGAAGRQIDRGVGEGKRIAPVERRETPGRGRHRRAPAGTARPAES